MKPTLARLLRLTYVDWSLASTQQVPVLSVLTSHEVGQFIAGVWGTESCLGRVPGHQAEVRPLRQVIIPIYPTSLRDADRT